MDMDPSLVHREEEEGRGETVEEAEEVVSKVISLLSQVEVTSEDSVHKLIIEDLFDPYSDIPDGVFIRIVEFLPVQSLKNCRRVNRRWNDICLSHKLLRASTTFVIDGRLLDQNGSELQTYILTESEHGFSIWSSLRILKCAFDQVSWMTRSLTVTITHLELNNCSMSWFNILRLISEIENLNSFADVQDMYCWDYVSFSQGLESDVLIENPGYLALNQEKLKTLINLTKVVIHRSQITDCTLYLKIFLLQCVNLEFLSVTSDQALSPRPTAAFYISLAQLVQKNVNTLQSLWFPYKCIYPIYEVRVADDHFPFRDFLTFVTDHHWGEEIQPKRLTELSIQFPVIHIEELWFKQKLLPFLTCWSTVRKLLLNCIFVEPGLQHLIIESIPSHIDTPILGVWWSDITTGHIPAIDQLKDICQTITIQPFRLSLGQQLRDFLPFYDPDDVTQTAFDAQNAQYPTTTELQFFSKSPHFRFFNIDLITRTFRQLTHLNLVDHNSRVDRNHTSDSPCTIEDEDLQLIITSLPRLTFLQLIGNLVYLTDTGITGISSQASRRMLKRISFIKMPGDLLGEPFHKLQDMKTVIFRGVGIKVTDVSAHFGFSFMPNLRKIHIYGAQQITSAGRVALQSQCWCSRGCDIQV